MWVPMSSLRDGRRDPDHSMRLFTSAFRVHEFVPPNKTRCKAGRASEPRHCPLCPWCPPPPSIVPHQSHPCCTRRGFGLEDVGCRCRCRKANNSNKDVKPAFGRVRSKLMQLTRPAPHHRPLYICTETPPAVLGRFHLGRLCCFNDPLLVLPSCPLLAPRLGLCSTPSH